jgi:phage-related protein
MAGLPISIGSVGVKIIPDMRGFVEKITAATKKITDVHIGIDVDSLAAETKLAAVTEMVDALDGRNIDINVGVDRAAVAAGQLALFDLESAVTDLSTSMDGVGVSASEWVPIMAPVGPAAVEAGAGATAGAGGFSLLGAAILGVIALAGPLTAVLIPALFGLATVVASVTAGIGVFAIAFVPLAKAVEAFRKAQLDPTTANLQALQKTLVGMPGAGRGLVLFIGTKLWPAFQKIQRAAERGLFPGLLKGLKAVMPLVQPLTKFVGSLARTLGDLAASAGKALNDKFWRGFFAFVTATAGPTLKTFAQIIGEVAKGIARMFEALGPMTQKIGQAILGLATQFAQWTASDSFTKFIAYMETNGPIFASLLGDLVVVGVKFLEAFAPLATVLLNLIAPVTQLLSALNPTELAYVVAAVLSIGTGFGLVAVAITGAALLIKEHWTAVKGFFEGIGHWFAGPFVGFFTSMGSDIEGAALAVAHAMEAAWNGVKSAVAAVGHWFAGPLVNFFTSGAHDVQAVFRGIVRVATDIGGGIKDAFQSVVHFIGGLPGKIAHAASGMWDGIKDAFRSAINWIIDGWNRLQFTLPKVNTHIPGVGTIGGWTLGTPDIPRLELGGIVTSPTLAMIGEGREPEVVAPLSRLPDLIPRQSMSPLVSGAGLVTPDGRLLAEVRGLRKDTVARLAGLERAVYGVGPDVADALNGTSKTAKHKGTARASS